MSRRNAFAKGSYSNLRTQVRTYFSFCVYFQLNPLPADSNTIYAYAQFLARTLKPPSVRNYLSGVKMLHILHGLSYSFSEDPLLQLELRGISRMNPHVPVRATPITPDILVSVWLQEFSALMRVGLLSVSILHHGAFGIHLAELSIYTAAQGLHSGSGQFFCRGIVNNLSTHQNHTIWEETLAYSFA